MEAFLCAVDELITYHRKYITANTYVCMSVRKAFLYVKESRVFRIKGRKACRLFLGLRVRPPGIAVTDDPAGPIPADRFY